MGLFSHLFGKASEDAASQWLVSRGFVLLKRNYKCRFGEIDIIAKKGDVLHFIEVKSSSSAGYDPRYRVTPAKLKRLLKAIEFYEMSEGTNEFMQLDLLVVSNEGFELIENISL